MRAWVALLLLANLGWLALAQGWLQPYVGLASAQQREPAEGEQFWLRVEQPDAHLQRQLQERLAAVPGSSLGACTALR